jgi:hypothetical protein
MRQFEYTPAGENSDVCGNDLAVRLRAARYDGFRVSRGRGFDRLVVLAGCLTLVAFVDESRLGVAR